MTYKAAAAGLNLGGGKGVICAPSAEPPEGELRAILHDFGDLVEVARRPLHHRGGHRHRDRGHGRDRNADQPRNRDAGERGGAGDPSPFTALGVQAAMRRPAARVRHQRPRRPQRRRGRVGHVGARLAQGLAAAGAELTLSDIDPDKRKVAASPGPTGWSPTRRSSRLGTSSRHARSAARSTTATRTPLRCRVVCGAANNQLADEAMAERLAARGILYAPDFIANAGGLINVYRELHRYDANRALELVLRIERVMADVFEHADECGTTPLESARALARRRLDGAMGSWCQTPPGERSAARGLVARLGLVPYEDGVELQKRLERARQADEIPDVLLLLEHHPVFTKDGAPSPGICRWARLVPDAGHRGRATDRGGQVTYHGPGQLVAYPLVKLPDDDVHGYVRQLERVMIATLGDFGASPGLRRPHGRLDRGRPADRRRRGRAAAHPGRDGRDPRWRGAQGRIDRDPREQGRDDSRARDQRQQRPAAVRLGSPRASRGCG